MKGYRRNENGQVLLFVLLGLTVTVTVVLSIISRSLTEVTVTKTEEDSLRAFSAAEAGIEDALAKSLSPGQTATGQVGQTGAEGTNSTTVANYTATVTDFGEGSGYNYPLDLLSGDQATIWMMGHDSSGSPTCTDPANPCLANEDTITLCWGTTGVTDPAGEEPAIEFGTLFVDPSDPGKKHKVAKAAFDPNSSRRGRNKFSGNISVGTCTIGSQDYKYSATINLQNLTGLVPQLRFTPNNVFKLVNVRLLYNKGVPHKVGVVTLNSPIPTQGRKIESVGLAGDSSRKVEVYSLYSAVPSMFDVAIFAPPGLVK